MNTKNKPPLLDKSGRLHLRPATIHELAVAYEVDRNTMRHYIEPFKAEIGQRKGYIYSIEQVKTIIAKLGSPEWYDEAV